MTDTKRQWLVRGLIGALAGVAVHVLLGYLLGCFSLSGPSGFSGFRFPDCGFHHPLEWLGILLSFALFALLGAEAGIATIPFAGSGKELVARSLIHFLVTAATVSAWVALNFRQEPFFALPCFLIPLTLVYALVWLGRWVGWYAEVAGIREKLGLAPGPSLFHWKETLPYLGFALLLCDVLPAVLRMFDAPDVPVLVGILLPYLLLPVGGFMSGLSLGRRHGFCPLYPIACALFFVPTVFLLMNYTALPHCLRAGIPALMGNLAGAAWHRRKQKTQS